MPGRALFALSLVLLTALLSGCNDPRKPALQTPDVYKSKEGVLHLRVRAKDVESTINGQRYKGMFVYETSLVDNQGVFSKGDASPYIGPEWRLEPGDKLIIDYINELPDYQFTGVDPHTGKDGPAQTLPQPLNLHTHGLTVSPAGNADNVLLSIPPQRSNRYTIDIPKDHHAGLYWYHPHIHGLSDDQVYGGLAGHIVVGRADGDYKEFDGLTVVPMAIRYNVQEPGDKGQLVDASPWDVHGTALVRDGGRMIYTVNGLVAPTVGLKAADRSRKLDPESQIWAFTNVTGSASYILALEEIDADKARDPEAKGSPLDLVIVSVDGSPLSKPIVFTGEKANYHLVQGGRVAILVQGASEPSKAIRLIQVQNRSGSGDKSAYDWPNQTYIGGWRDYTRDVLAVGYSDSAEPRKHVPTPESLTLNRPVEKTDLTAGDPDYKRGFVFNDVAPPNAEMPNAFPINFGLFPYNGVAQPRVGTVEEWTVLNWSSLTHPFHFHTQFGQVMKIEAPVDLAVNPNFIPTVSRTQTPYPTLQYVTDMEALSPAAFTQDVVALPPAKVGNDGMPDMLPDSGTPSQPGKLVMRLKFLDYLGTYVEHCHRLPHEDRGMMSLVRSIPNVPVVAVAAQGTDASASTVSLVNGLDQSVFATLTPFPEFKGPLATAVGDVNGDAIPDVAVASGPGRQTTLRVYFGRPSQEGKPRYEEVDIELHPFETATNGASVALGDLNGDHQDELLVGEGSGGSSRVVIYDGGAREEGVERAMLSRFQPYEEGFKGGVNVAAGMVEEGGRVSFFTAPGAGRSPEVRMYNVDLYGSAQGEFPKVHESLMPLLVVTFDGADRSYEGGLSITTGYPFARKGGFASVITSTLRGLARVNAYTVSVAGHDHGGAASPSGVHRAVPYYPDVPRQVSLVASTDLGVSAPALASGATVGLFSTVDGAVLMAVPSNGGKATLWNANPEGNSFVYEGTWEVSGSVISGM